MKAKLNNLIYKYENQRDALKKQSDWIAQIKMKVLEEVVNDLRKLKE
jgi:hypothetical protein